MLVECISLDFRESKKKKNAGQQVIKTCDSQAF